LASEATTGMLAQLKQLLAKNHFDFEATLSSAINQKIQPQRLKLCLTTLKSLSASIGQITSSASTNSNMPILLKTITEQIINGFSEIPQDLLQPLIFEAGTQWV
jgi:hypothetical protein